MRWHQPWAWRLRLAEHFGPTLLLADAWLLLARCQEYMRERIVTRYYQLQDLLCGATSG